MKLNMEEYTKTAREAAADGCVVLKNEKRTLPLKEGSKLAIFGRIQHFYYKSGTGSGGMVNVTKTVGILDALLQESTLTIDPVVLETYREWAKTNPPDKGEEWATEPWSQEEMPVTDKWVLEAANRNDAAIIIIGRTAGEDRDNVNEKGAYELSDLEIDLIEKVTASFEKVIILYNVGSIIQMTHPCQDKCQAIVYVWQGGMIGGYGVADILTGRVNPSGRLTDTIAREIKDYPSTANFGDEIRNYYQEDIYVGYRYFETVAKDQVLYPFGFGLSYTTFEESLHSISEKNGTIDLTITVKNTGNVSGRQVVQVYIESPQGALGKPSRVLVDFAKTNELQPEEEQQIHFHISPYTYASYDDSGVTGHAFCYVLEAGTYAVYAGANVRDAARVSTFDLESLRIVDELSQNLAPVRAFTRMKPVMGADGRFQMDYEDVPLGEKREADKRLQEMPTEIPYSGDKGYRLRDVKENKISLEQFIAQLTDEDLSCIIRGEGMGSPKVTPGTAAAYGGISEHLKQFGIPCGCCTDGPSGIRMDSGTCAFSLPNGTMMACTFDPGLLERLYSFVGIEMIQNKIDNLLGPGINIHRNPLNGRNFEYFSEDPLITGKMAAAQLRGLHKAGVTGTIKHFAANNQETKRTEVDSVVSERALREIYLKGFELAVKESEADSIMTTYGALNGVWTAGRYELNTSILRNEWGFSGIVMTDWWVKVSNQEQEEARSNDFASMIRAQNDLYMVCQEADKNTTDDNTLSELSQGTLERSELQRSAMNICRHLMTTPSFARMIDETSNS